MNEEIFKKVVTTVTELTNEHFFCSPFRILRHIKEEDPSLFHELLTFSESGEVKQGFELIRQLHTKYQIFVYNKASCTGKDAHNLLTEETAEEYIKTF